MSTAVAPPRLGPRLGADFFARPVAEVAPGLIGCTLLVDGVGGVIVETERYQQDDPASHSFRGPRGRAAVMFGPPGRVYVYRSTGCTGASTLCARERAAGPPCCCARSRPTEGSTACARAGGPFPIGCCAPARGASARRWASIETSTTTSAIDTGARVAVHARTAAVEVVSGPRIGISVATEIPWRFGLAGSRHLSKPFPRP